MTDRQLQSKLNQIARLSNELVEEAQARYGSNGMLFFESDGTFHIMSGDADSGAEERQKYIEFSSEVYSRMGAGAW